MCFPRALTLLLPRSCHQRFAANSSSHEDHFVRSLAVFSQVSPLVFANWVKLSLHRSTGLPHLRRPIGGSQSNKRLDHLPSSLRATCPAHRHLRRLCSSAFHERLPTPPLYILIGLSCVTIFDCSVKSGLRIPHPTYKRSTRSTTNKEGEQSYSKNRGKSADRWHSKRTIFMYTRIPTNKAADQRVRIRL